MIKPGPPTAGLGVLFGSHPAMFALGAAKFSVLVTLKASARNCSVSLSWIGISLLSEVSNCLVGGARKMPGPSFPTVPCGCAANAARLNPTDFDRPALIFTPGTLLGRSLVWPGILMRAGFYAVSITV